MLDVYKKIRLSGFGLLKACSLSILFWGCSGFSESGIPSITVPRDTSGELLLRDLAKSVGTIQLETNEHALLHNVAHVKLFDEQLFVGDYHRVLIFDMQGNFLDSLGSRGRAPGSIGGTTRLPSTRLREPCTWPPIRGSWLIPRI